MLEGHMTDDLTTRDLTSCDLCQSVYPAAEQMALDMLQRLGNADEEIIEIMLSRNDVTSALRWVDDVTGPLNSRVVTSPAC